MEARKAIGTLDHPFLNLGKCGRWSRYCSCRSRSKTGPPRGTEHVVPVETFPGSRSLIRRKSLARGGDRRGAGRSGGVALQRHVQPCRTEPPPPRYVRQRVPSSASAFGIGLPGYYHLRACARRIQQPTIGTNPTARRWCPEGVEPTASTARDALLGCRRHHSDRREVETASHRVEDVIEFHVSPRRSTGPLDDYSARKGPRAVEQIPLMKRSDRQP